MDLQALKQPIKYQWKIQTVSQTSSKAQCVAYIDARDVMDLLDLVVKPENWQDKYEVVGDKFIAGIGIKIDNEWIWKWDTGTAGDFEQEKSIFSDSFKRAAVKWGIGRFLYDLDFKWVNTDKPGKGAHPVDENGKRIYNLTEYFEKIGDRVVDSVPKQTTSSPKPSTATKEDKNDSEVKCPNCGGQMWDNRPKKAAGEFNPAAPDFKCRDKSCGGVIWPPKDKPMAADGSDYMESLLN